MTSQTGENSALLWLKILAGSESEIILKQGIDRVTKNLSTLAGRPIRVADSSLKAIPITQLFDYIGDPEVETVGIYLLIEGQLQGQALIMFALPDALHLVNRQRAEADAEIKQFDETARKAIGQIARLMLSSFVEVVSEQTKIAAEASAPAVMVDMGGAIIDVVAATSIVANSDNLVVLEAMFKDQDKLMQCRLWILPDPDRDELA